MRFTCRLGRHFYWLVPLLMALAATPAVQAGTTTVQDIVYRADGTPARGTLVISWPAFTSADHLAVAAGSKSVPIGPGGAISVALVPNAGGTPEGTYYRVVYKLDDGSTSEEYWSVPATDTTTIAAVRSRIVPANVAVQVASRQYVDSAIAAALAGAPTGRVVTSFNGRTGDVLPAANDYRYSQLASIPSSFNAGQIRGRDLDAPSAPGQQPTFDGSKFVQQSKLYTDLRDYGIAGAGSRTVNQHNALQAAIDATPDGGEIRCPAGTSIWTSQINIIQRSGLRFTTAGNGYSGGTCDVYIYTNGGTADDTTLINLDSSYDVAFDGWGLHGNDGYNRGAGVQYVVDINKRTTGAAGSGLSSSHHTFRNGMIETGTTKANAVAVIIGNDNYGDNSEFMHFENVQIYGWHPVYSGPRYGIGVKLVHANVKNITFDRVTVGSLDKFVHAVNSGTFTARGTRGGDTNILYYGAFSDNPIIEGDDIEDICQAIVIPSGSTGSARVMGSRWVDVWKGASGGPGGGGNTNCGTSSAPVIEWRGSGVLELDYPSLDSYGFSSPEVLAKSMDNQGVLILHGGNAGAGAGAAGFSSFKSVIWFSSDRGMVAGGNSLGVIPNGYSFFQQNGNLVRGWHIKPADEDGPCTAGRRCLGSGEIEIAGTSEANQPRFTVVGTAGTQALAVQVYPKDADGNRALYGAEGYVSNAPDTLNGSNYVTVSLDAAPLWSSTFDIVHRCGNGTLAALGTSVSLPYNITANPNCPGTYSAPTYNESASIILRSPQAATWALGPTTIQNPNASGSTQVIVKATAAGSGNSGSPLMSFQNSAGTTLGFFDYNGTFTAAALNATSAIQVNGSQISSANLSDGGSLVKASGKIINADLQPGSDWCAKVNAADAALGSGLGQIWMTSAAGNTACSADVIINSGHTLREVEGATYQLQTHSIKLDSRSALIGTGRPQATSLKETMFFYTGTGSAIVPKTTTDLTYHIVLHDFGVADKNGWDGGAAAATASAGIDMVNVAHCNVDNVAAYSFGKTGAAAIRRYTTGMIAGAYYCTFRDVYGTYNYDGMVWDSDATAKTNFDTWGTGPIRDTIVNSQLDISSHYAYDLRDQTGAHRFFGPKAENFGVAGMHIATRENTVWGASIEDHHNAGQIAVLFDGHGCDNVLAGSFWTDPRNDLSTKVVDNNACPSGTGGDTPGNMVENFGAFGALKIGGGWGLPKTANWHLWFGSDDDTSRLGRMYIGDGSGTKRVEFAKRLNSVDTPLMGLRDTTEFFLYRPTTYTDETHFESGWLHWDGNIFALGTGVGSQGGTNRSMCLEPGGLQTLCSNSSTVFFNRDNLVDIGTSGYKPRTIYAGTSVDTPKLTGITDTGVVTNLNADRWHSKTAADFSASLDFASIAAQSCGENTIAVTGATTGSAVAPAWPSTLETGLAGVMFVSGSGTVKVRLCNVTSSAIDPAPQSFGGRAMY